MERERNRERESKDPLLQIFASVAACIQESRVETTHMSKRYAQTDI